MTCWDFLSCSKGFSYVLWHLFFRMDWLSGTPDGSTEESIDRISMLRNTLGQFIPPVCECLGLFPSKWHFNVSFWTFSFDMGMGHGSEAIGHFAWLNSREISNNIARKADWRDVARFEALDVVMTITAVYCVTFTDQCGKDRLLLHLHTHRLSSAHLEFQLPSIFAGDSTRETRDFASLTLRLRCSTKRWFQSSRPN